MGPPCSPGRPARLNVRVEVNGRARTVDVRPGGRRYDVSIDGRSAAVDLVRTPTGWSLLLDGRSHEVALEDGPAGTAVYVDGQRVPVTLPDARRFGAGGRHADGGPQGPGRITSPMPGRVVKVLVAPGDQVVARQGLVVVEAMKMENELRAPAAGTVTEVRVTEGASVEANAVLVILA